MSALAQLSFERIAQLEYDRDYLKGQVDCLIGNPSKYYNAAYLIGYGDAYAMQAQATARTEQAELPEGCF
jgi:hypothetical protein